ncbi:MAG: helix-turn-helix transcriptional regulator [Enterobacterales bacterium endosymbiont of Blomia tropicalis]|uniref:helix-turn-helix transcriptional regulator n=1 Tax=Mixta mediterraneensis TaxID=2758443 RepID=UPI0018750D6E|nr:helix-turn-helix transcriptional regulator [Mixta mediterraneensis]MBE5250965.1 transcriptional regulator [Mixta mediterraneensis]MDL4916178.1 helix-turn-helix transcriptional regulator [Mixta mediterraneensis]
MQPLSPQETVKALIASGLTQVEIQARTGISQASISRIVSGKNADPRLSVVRTLENLFSEVKAQTAEQKA